MLTLKEAAQTIGCSSSHVGNLISKGTIAGTKSFHEKLGRVCWQIDMTRQQLLEAVPQTGAIGWHPIKKRMSVNGNGHSHRSPMPRISPPLIGLTAWLQLPVAKRDLLQQIGERFTEDDLALILSL